MKHVAFSKYFAFLVVAALMSSFTVSVAKAESMKCLLAVYTAGALVDSSKGIENYAVKVVAPVVDGNVDYEADVNGEKVLVSMIKKQYVDMYDVTFALTTPVADRQPRSKIVTMIVDSLYNDGPTKNDGWDLDPSPTSDVFKYVRESTGAFSYSSKLVNALKTEGLWRTPQFSRAVVGVSDMQNTIDFVKTQLAEKKMKPTDVMGLASLLTCTHEKN